MYIQLRALFEICLGTLVGLLEGSSEIRNVLRMVSETALRKTCCCECYEVALVGANSFLGI